MGRPLGSVESAWSKRNREIAEMLDLYARGCSQSQIARCQGLNRQTISERLKKWKPWLDGLDKITSLQGKRVEFLSRFEVAIVNLLMSGERVENASLKELAALLRIVHGATLKEQL